MGIISMNINKFSKLKVLGIKLGISEKLCKYETYLHPCEAVLYNGILYLTFNNKIDNNTICISTKIEENAEQEILKDGVIKLHHANVTMCGLDVFNIAPTNIPGYIIMARLILFKNGEVQGILGRSHVFPVDTKRFGVCAKVSIYLNKKSSAGLALSEDYLVNDSLEVYEMKDELTEEEKDYEEWDIITYELDYGVRRMAYIRRTDKLDKHLITIEEIENQ